MATSNTNAQLYGMISGDGISKVLYPSLNATAVVHQGDLVYYDTTAKIVKPLDTDGHAATFAGVALQPSTVSSNLDNSGAPAQNSLVVGWNGVFSMKSTSGDTYSYGDSVYLGADAQTVTNTAGGSTHILGRIVLPAGVSSLAGGAGIMVQVKIPAPGGQTTYL